MTVIVLDTDDDNIVLAADRLWVTGDELLVHHQVKLMPILRGTKQIGAVAAAGDACRSCKLEIAVIKAFKGASNSTPLEVLKLAVENFLKEAPKSKEDSIEDAVDAIVVIRGIGYVIDDDGFITPQKRWAIGTGGHIALGAMWNRKGAASRLAKLGAQAATELLASCGGEIDIFEMPKQQT